MGNYTMFGKFENPRRGVQARNLTTNVPKNSRSQIVFRTDIFQKLSLGAPESDASASAAVLEDANSVAPRAKYPLSLL